MQPAWTSYLPLRDNTLNMSDLKQLRSVVALSSSVLSVHRSTRGGAGNGAGGDGGWGGRRWPQELEAASHMASAG